MQRIKTMRRSGAIKAGKRSISFCAVLLAALFPLAGEAKMGLGADCMFTGYAPFGGGAGITARFEKVPIAATLSGAYLHGNNGMIKGSVDYWFLSEKLVDINDSSSLHWFAGIGLFTGVMFYSVPAASASAGKNAYTTALGGNIGFRLPIGCYFFAGQKKYEPYFQCSPECGVDIYPKTFAKRTALLWAFPLSLGCRFWF